VLEQVSKFAKSLDPDVALQAVMGSLIKGVVAKTAFGGTSVRWKPGDSLKLLLAGYNGTRNTGADVRVEEMIRQFRHILGDDKIELSVLTQDIKRTAGYFRTCRQVVFPQAFPKILKVV